MGEFSTHVRQGDHVTKQLHRNHPSGATFMATLSGTGAAGMQTYVDLLRAANVTLPADLHVIAGDPLAVQHCWVSGPTLLDATPTSATSFATQIAQIGHWVRALDTTDARIDTNLANFCLVNDLPVLVDVLPPLIPSLRPEPDNLFDELFGALCFDTPVILDALIGYGIRAALRMPNSAGARAVLPVADELIDRGHDIDAFPARWFAARRELAMRAAAGDADSIVVQDFFALTSVLGFRQLTEEGRNLRIGRVARRSEELGLC